MIGSDTLTFFPGSQTLLGKQVSELVGDDLTVKADGSVTGTFHHVTGRLLLPIPLDQDRDQDDI